MFEDDDLAEAMGVPLFYGFVEAVLLGIYCLLSWKLDWTKAPSTDPFLRVVSVSYEVLSAQELEKSISDSERTKGDEFTIQKHKSSSHIQAVNMESDCTYTNYECEDQKNFDFRIKEVCVSVRKWGDPIIDMCDSVLLSMKSLKENIIGQQPELESQSNNGVLA